MDLKINSFVNTYSIDAMKPRTNVVKKEVEPKQTASVFTPSTEALEYQNTLNTVKSSSDVRQDKVDEIKQKISSNSYRVDLSALADKIVSGE